LTPEFIADVGWWKWTLGRDGGEENVAGVELRGAVADKRVIRGCFDVSGWGAVQA